MEARIKRAALLAVILTVSMGARFQTPNFIIETRDPQLAEQFGKAAEVYRRDLAISWLGEAMPNWAQPCPITVKVGPRLGAGGATSFVFDRGEVFGWRMTIQGSAQRVLDSVLPHEITHMIFASHFRRPLPRWADEGGATTVECTEERHKHHTMLVEFLHNNRGIAFNRMFAMTEYPSDIMPLYAQGFTLSDFLIQQGGRRKFLKFLALGMENDQWTTACKEYYDLDSVGTLQNAWLSWVRHGFPKIQTPLTEPIPPQIAATETPTPDRRPRPEPNLLVRVRNPRPLNAPTAEWHASGSPPPDATEPEIRADPFVAYPITTQAAHPQPIEKSRQIILEWGDR